MMPPTMRAHCGACSGLMVLRIDYRGCYFVCRACGIETPPHLTVADADADVVWVPVTTPTTKSLNGEQG